MEKELLRSILHDLEAKAEHLKLLQEWADKQPNLPQHLWSDERRHFEADRQWIETGLIVPDDDEAKDYQASK